MLSEETLGDAALRAMLLDDSLSEAALRGLLAEDQPSEANLCGLLSWLPAAAEQQQHAQQRGQHPGPGTQQPPAGWPAPAARPAGHAGLQQSISASLVDWLLPLAQASQAHGTSGYPPGSGSGAPGRLQEHPSWLPPDLHIAAPAAPAPTHAPGPTPAPTPAPTLQQLVQELHRQQCEQEAEALGAKLLKVCCAALCCAPCRAALYAVPGGAGVPCMPCRLVSLFESLQPGAY